MYFRDIIGNENVKKNLIESINNDNVLHAYMFIGKDGIGKKLIAQEFARLIMCEDKTKDVEASNCKSCRMLDTNNHPDFVLIEPDGNSIKIDQIRNMIAKIYEKPIISSKKVYIINNAEKMTQESNNCLLKILEEPPSFVVIVLIVSSENSMLDTIKSRCNKIIFNRIDDKMLEDFLQKEYSYPLINKRVEKIIDGSVSKALEIKENLGIYSIADEILDIIEKHDIIELFKRAELIKQSTEPILEYFMFYFMERLKENVSNIEYARAIEIIEETKNCLKLNGNVDMVLDKMIIDLWEEFKLK